ncbi:MAG TPA: T9SS type A sorting domain-containing protein [Chitinophagales bacterium]|nr:T9SS type A sorting domain-containing protein [Chitinophagales bacterium]
MKNKIAFIVMSVFVVSLHAQPTLADYCTYYGSAKYPDYSVEKCNPIIDMGDVDLCGESGYSPSDFTDYFGRNGGLYPDYDNFPPATYAAAFPDLNSEFPIVMVGVGPSIPESIIERLQSMMPACQLDSVVLINAGLPGMDFYDANIGFVKITTDILPIDESDDSYWAMVDPPYESDFDDGDMDDAGRPNIVTNAHIPYWDCVEFLIYKAGYTPEDVDVLWAMQGLIGKNSNTGYQYYNDDEEEWQNFFVQDVGIVVDGSGHKDFDVDVYNSEYFEDYIYVFNQAYRDFLDGSRADGEMSELKAVYLSDVPYSGYAIDNGKHELLPPYDYWNGWGVKQVVEDYINGDFWSDTGDPYITWGPYFWRRSYKESYFDGYQTDFSYVCEDFFEDEGFHLSNSGKNKTAAFAKYYFRQTNWYYPDDCPALVIDCPERLGQSASNLNVLCTQSGDALEIFVLNGSSTDTYQFALYNLMGQQVFEQHGGTEAVVSGLPAGQYFYAVTNNYHAQLATGAAVYVK